MKKQQNWRMILFSFLLLAFANAKAQLNITPTITPSCQSNSGAVVFTFSGAHSGMHYYSLQNNYASLNSQTSSTFTNLAPGDYTFTVSGVDSGRLYITIPSVITTTITASNATCPQNNGSLSAIVHGGSAPYSYLWSNGANTPSINNLSQGSYFLTVTDANGCINNVDSTFNYILQTSSIEITWDTVTTNCNPFYSAIVTGGNPPYSFAWNNGSTNSNSSQLGPGFYNLEVTDNDGCKGSKGLSIDSGGWLSNASVTINHPLSCGNTNGSISIVPLFGTSPYTFSWSNGANTSSISNLTAGAYTVTITDKNGCSGSRDFNLMTLPFSYHVHYVNPTCTNNGLIYVYDLNGTAPFTFNWSNGGGNVDSINNLAPGSYSFTVTDALGCTSIGTYNLSFSSGNPLIASIYSVNLPSCGSTDGSLAVNINSGVPPFTYQWTNGISTLNTANNLGVGNYAVTVTDANGCSSSASANLFSSIQITPTITPACTPGSGAVTGTLSCANNGTHFYTLYNQQTGTHTQQTSPTFSNLDPGNYVLMVGGVDSGYAVITIPNVISTTFNSTNIKCPNTGSIVATVTGGQTPYTYQWSNGATTSSISNLTQSGVYSFTVQDMNGCQAIGNDSIGDTSTFSPNITNTGSLCHPIYSSAPNGGIAPYTFLWSDGSNASSITNLVSGTYYSLTVIDATGCHGYEYKYFTYDSTLSSMIDSVLIVPVSSCNGNLGSITITKLLGQAPYTFLWSNGQTTSSINNLQSGYYTVTTTDASGCSGSKLFYISYAGNTVSGHFDTIQHTMCGGNTGKIHFSPYGGTAPYTYQWTNNSSITNTAENLTAGGYYVTITDAVGCSALFATTINGITTFSEQITTTPSDCNLSIHNGTATINVSGGGTPPFSYAWYSGNTYIGNTQTVTNLAAYKWVYVKVSDAQGCIAHDSVATFTMPDTNCGGVCHAHFSIQPDPNTAHNWTVDNTSSSAHMLYYSWYWGDGSYSTGVSPSHTYSTPGYFNICLYVSDSTGCIDSYCDSSTYVFKTDEIITVNVVDKTAISTFIEKPTEEKQFMVFPNPSNGIFNIQLPVEIDNKDVNLNVTNLLGEVVFSKKMTQQNTTLDITQQPKGIYIVSFQGIDGLINKKLIKE
jgi:hypothetical protein